MTHEQAKEIGLVATRGADHRIIQSADQRNVYWEL